MMHPAALRSFVVPFFSCFALFAGLLLALGTSAAAAAEDGLYADGATPGEIYRDACAGCHGADGRGAPPSVVGFHEPLPDFTDCSFATREPDADWYAVTHGGGPVRAFSPMMPSFGAALAADEIEMAVTHVRTFCPDESWPPGHLNLPRALVTEKAFPEDEAVYTVIVLAEGEGRVDHELVYEQRFGARNQFEVVVPFAQAERRAGPDLRDTEWHGGLKDVALGLKRAVFHDDDSIFSVAGEVILPTGDEDEGFGSGHVILEPFVAFGQVLPRDFFLHAQAGGEIPLESDADDEAFLRLAVGKSFIEGSFGRVWSPMVELLGSRELVSGAETHWDAAPQLQVTLSRRQHVMLNAGLRVPLDDTDGRDTRVMVYVLWDWFDGGLLEGWR